MSAQLRVYNHISVAIDDNIIDIGSLHRPRFISISGEHERIVATVEASSTQELWNVDNSPLGDFDFLAVCSDRDVTIEFIVDDDNDVGEVVFTLKTHGTGRDGEYGPMIMLCDDTSYANASAGFGGTADVIEKVSAKNEDSSTSANVLLFVVT